MTSVATPMQPFAPSKHEKELLSRGRSLLEQYRASQSTLSMSTGSDMSRPMAFLEQHFLSKTSSPHSNALDVKGLPAQSLQLLASLEQELQKLQDGSEDKASVMDTITTLLKQKRVVDTRLAASRNTPEVKHTPDASHVKRLEAELAESQTLVEKLQAQWSEQPSDTSDEAYKTLQATLAKKEESLESLRTSLDRVVQDYTNVSEQLHAVQSALEQERNKSQQQIATLSERRVLLQQALSVKNKEVNDLCRSELPMHWEAQTDDDGIIFYRRTDRASPPQLEDPRLSKENVSVQEEEKKVDEKSLTNELPPGWEMKVTNGGYVFFVNDELNVTTWADPRKYQKSTSTTSRHSHHSDSSSIHNKYISPSTFHTDSPFSTEGNEVRPSIEETVRPVQVFNVEFTQAGSLGIHFKQNEPDAGARVSGVLEDTPAMATGAIQAGDRLVGVNDQSVASAPFRHTMLLLKGGLRPLSLTFERDPNVESDLEETWTHEGVLEAPSVQEDAKEEEFGLADQIVTNVFSMFWKAPDPMDEAQIV